MRILLLLAVLLPSASTLAAEGDFRIPVATRRLPNGLTVVVSEDHSAPTFGLSLTFRVGMRLEPEGRTGFAHLFEHMMFQGTPNAPKGTFDRVIEGGGGSMNGFTRSDYTTYIDSAPTSALDAVLWMEADRMKALDLSDANLKNQQDVVKEEIRVNVKNKPYGLFFWTDLTALAFDRWENAHDGYGSFQDLEAARLADVQSFFKSYYAPGNAVLVVAGDVKPEEVFAKAGEYFGSISARPAPPRPVVDEGPNQKERRLDQTDPLARAPAVAIGWKLPARAAGDPATAAVLAGVLLDGPASRLYLALVKGKELAMNVDGGPNWPLGDAWDYDGPVLFAVYAIYKPTSSANEIVGVVEEELRRIARDGVPDAELARVKTKLESDLYARLEMPVYRAIALAQAQLFDGDAATVNLLPGRIRAVTSEDLRRLASTILVPSNRSVVDRQPAPPAQGK
jgi:predicted Zn-dependent peptidase